MIKMSENTSPNSFNTTPNMDFFKKLKRLKLLELSPTILGCFFFTFCLIFCLFLLDYRVVDNGKHAFLATWFFGFNNGSSSGDKKVNFLEEGGNGCDIFDGNWVWDKTYPIYDSKDCLFMDEGFRCSENGRPDNFYTKWRWQPKACNLPRFDAKDMLERLKNRRLVFVGDSIGRNQWESLLCMLSSAIPDKTSIYEVNAPFLVLQSRAPSGAPDKVKMTLKLDQMDWSSNKWMDADILIFNSGHWWNYEKTIRGGCYFQEGTKIEMEMSVENAFRRSLVTLFDWISREVNMTKTHVFFRSYAPVHFRGGDWKTGGSCHLERLPDLSSSPVSSDELNLAIDVLSNHLKKSQLRNLSFLNVTSMTSRRIDGHSSLYYLGPKELAPLRRQDCSHWCLPGVPDVWNELLYAVYLKREIIHPRNSSRPSHSSG